MLLAFKDLHFGFEDMMELSEQVDWENTVREHDDFVSAAPGEIICNVDGKPEEFDTWQAAGTAIEIDDPQRNEAYEHWVVSGWFALPSSAPSFVRK